MKVSPLMFGLAWLVSVAAGPVLATDSTLSAWDQALTVRGRLQQQLTADRFSRHVKLNETERRADAALARLKQMYRGAPREDVPPAVPFYMAHPAYEAAPLMQVLKAMPKGCLLHADPYATGTLDIVLHATYDPHVYLYTGNSSEGTEQASLGYFRKNPGQPWRQVVELRKLAKDDRKYDSALLKYFTIDTDDELRTDTRAEYARTVNRLRPLMRYAPAWVEQVENTCHQLASRGVQYAEFRTPLESRQHADGTWGDDEQDLERWIVIRDSVRAHSDHFDFNIVVTVPRTDDPQVIAEAYTRTVELDRAHPGIIVGFDIEGRETGTWPLVDDVPALWEAHEKAEKAGAAVPFLLQAGQSVSVDNLNVLDALTLGSRRIGHALTLAHDPSLATEVAKREVCVELSPIEDQVMGYVGDLRGHPAVAMMNSGVPVVLTPYATGILGASIDDTWFAAIVAWDLDLADVKAMLLNSFDYANVPESERDSMRATWKTAWDNFVKSLAKGVEPEPEKGAGKP